MHLNKPSDVQWSLVKIHAILGRWDRSYKFYVGIPNFLHVFCGENSYWWTRIDQCRKIVTLYCSFHHKWTFANTSNRHYYDASSFVIATITGIAIINVINTSTCILVCRVLCIPLYSQLEFLTTLLEKINDAASSTFFLLLYIVKYVAA